MFQLALNFLLISTAVFKDHKLRLEKITLSIIQFEDSIRTNSRIIQGLNNRDCNPFLLESKKTEISRDIHKLFDEKNYIDCLNADDCLLIYRKDKNVLKTEIDRKINHKTAIMQSEIKKFNDSIENRTAYERINASMRNKISSLETEKRTIQNFLEQNKFKN
ncbi:hypothetical protein EDEG_03915 [Edhazardia aedis USNM 41457]|uniref:Uncharacterized protein n=1 Tax=Edhazardia aedis (strain USNM 41457) TaxID=1003232 RepID=J9DFX7_EDHAE|nr:hypothetical protein EDEG_03915 [Edhazardia aedis USNM 41457]|eukprot:EJW01510.1 hypothetical protein EDEG_03915 [Edhazardia aedis USNM 41457]